ncbi:gluconokinase [Cohnella lupini]|uniref:Gluconokinase n=1 Tax=Cohnella lupini TaxID=1294267 RepID=A0A3D9IWD8_9BACL|nr:gluconokinase [Cohnella lupini]RED66153.1 hypothetical protein DFP95_101651 [Cohnella lupini]
MERCVYIISGPAGAGKSTTSKIIAERLTRSAYIEGDLIDHMVIGGHEMPWLSTYHSDLIWLNISSLTLNYLKHDHDVVIDYVAFFSNADMIKKKINDRKITIKFVVLIVGEEELLGRDAERIPEHQMGQRCIEGLKEILQSNPPEKHLITTTDMEVEDVVNEIMNNPRFIVKN